ncbi:MAG: metal ABC transporter permease [Candidatus Kariarchaeaceae archaeon]|jgi:manganese/zinc/iron transport system permease protein
MSLLVELMVIAVLSTVIMSLPGNYLVLRGNSLSTFALSHSVLTGIVVAYLITEDLNSPYLIIGAALTGIIIVWLVELIASSSHVNLDAALGLVYLTFFALGILLVARYTANTVLSVNSVLLGSIALVPFDRLIINGRDLGPIVSWNLLILLIINIGFLAGFYKEIKISIFDPEYGRLFGFRPELINLAYMILTSISIVVVFRVAGIIVVVALAAIPAATSYLITRKFHQMILVSTGLAVLTAVIGTLISWFWGDVEVASVISTVSGVIFIGVLFSKRLIPKVIQEVPV